MIVVSDLTLQQIEHYLTREHPDFWIAEEEGRHVARWGTGAHRVEVFTRDEAVIESLMVHMGF
jgi:N-acetylglutamate synthase-like GNAT family acetyltransferase